MTLTEKKRILLVEDEPHLAFNLAFNLQAEGLDVVPANNGQLALELYGSRGPFDLILLDVMLPDLNGFEIAKKIREKSPMIGIIMLTAKSSEDDRLHGFQSGVDDYLIKPFSLQELILRVKRMLLRSTYFEKKNHLDSPASILVSGKYKLDMENLELYHSQKKFALTLLEAKILQEFFINPNRVISREHLLENVWGLNAHLETRTIDNFVVRLRRYIEDDPANPIVLISVRGRGYKYSLLPENPTAKAEP